MDTPSASFADNNADGLGTYTTYGPSVGGGDRGALWISVRNALIGSATSTDFAPTNSSLNGGGTVVLTFSGMTKAGAAAVVQSIGEDTATENPPTITFASAVNTDNPVVLGVLGEDNPLALTPPAGFSEAVDLGWNTPTTGIEVCFIGSGSTASLFSWSGGAVTDHNEFGIELDASAPPSANGSLGWWGMGGLGSTW